MNESFRYRDDALIDAKTVNAYIEEVEELRKALNEAYIHNQNMHCYQTKGRLNEELNKRTIILRTAIEN